MNIIRLSFVLIVGLALTSGAAAETTIYFEAEQAQTIEKHFQKVDEPYKDIKGRPSSKGYLYIPDKVNPKDKDNVPLPDPPGKVVFEINVPKAGQYNLWIRRWWMDSCGNSVFVMVEGSPTKHVFGEEATYQYWYWSKLKNETLSLKAGVNRLVLLNREDGIRLDQVCLTTDDRYTPVGVRPPTPGALVPKK